MSLSLGPVLMLFAIATDIRKNQLFDPSKDQCVGVIIFGKPKHLRLVEVVCILSDVRWQSRSEHVINAHDQGQSDISLRDLRQCFLLSDIQDERGDCQNWGNDLHRGKEDVDEPSFHVLCMTFHLLQVSDHLCCSIQLFFHFHSHKDWHNYSQKCLVKLKLLEVIKL